ncbi:dihydrofolate reductase family protein [Nocardia yamanashiensis]|uniref:dihydrofolate reductase family protein n=1 Tax=Nocardia yamanashiensis TaxID=209247 RepID=UPI001E5600A8|nr:dihydrofolate reductase family protein [Nocardia yamanashiensis]UGT42951.1 dihydrofolate reductase family protein [Nocardia yamanashiensis]
MTHTVYYAASSIDGYIADEKHSLDWLLTRDNDGAGPMGYDTFIAGVGAIVMGSNTYQWLLDHDPGNWPYDMPAWVVTHREFPAWDGKDIRFTSMPVPELHAEMAAAAGGKDLWVVGGGDLAGQFADHGLLDEIVVCYAPVTLGGGAPVLPRRLELKPLELAMNGELACARYAIVRG